MKDTAAMLSAINRAIADELFSPTLWEDKFLGNMEDLVAFEFDLTDEQDKKLEEIWKRATR